MYDNKENTGVFNCCNIQDCLSYTNVYKCDKSTPTHKINTARRSMTGVCTVCSGYLYVVLTLVVDKASNCVWPISMETKYIKSRIL